MYISFKLFKIPEKVIFFNKHWKAVSKVIVKI